MAVADRHWCQPNAQLPRATLESVPGITPLQHQVLANRGILPAQMRAWLVADPALLAPPDALPDLACAVRRLRRAIGEREPICIVGDCDVDGLTATAILYETLAHLGARLTDPVIMPRSEDGRGLTLTAVEQVISNGARLCVTVDNGSSSHAEAQCLADRGCDLIITDHHHIDTPYPTACAIVNPQRADAPGYPNPAIAGAGVAFQLARALFDDPPLDAAPLPHLIELAGLGTLADVVALSPENHVLGARALRQMRIAPRPGIQALLARATPAPLTDRTIGYHIAPRLNAAGRLGDPLVALRLLLADSIQTAEGPARQLEAWNLERQQLTETIVRAAREQATRQLAAGDAIIFVQAEDWEPGVVGLVATRLASEYRRLAVVVACNGTSCRGSLRSPPGFHIAAALKAFQPALEQAGGHSQAGGFTARPDQLPDLHAYLDTAYRQALHEPLAESEPGYAVDLAIPLPRIIWERADMVRQLAPFGPGFTEPLFVTPGVRVDTRTISIVGGAHAKFDALDATGRARRSFFWPGGAQYLAVCRTAVPLDLLWRFPSGGRDAPFARQHPEPVLVDVLSTQ